MIDKDFLPYDLTKELEALGYFEDTGIPICGWITPRDGGRSELLFGEAFNNFKKFYDVGSILYSQAFRWFRDKHKIRFEITTLMTEHGLCYRGEIDKRPLALWDSYEGAEKACLEYLIEIIKENVDGEV